VDHAVDKSDISEHANIDVVAADADDSPSPASLPQKLTFVDAVSVGMRADEAVVQVFSVPGSVGIGECAHPRSVQEVELRDGLRLPARGLEGRIEKAHVPLFCAVATAASLNRTSAPHRPDSDSFASACPDPSGHDLSGPVYLGAWRL
jgi:hypothetical protein